MKTVDLIFDFASPNGYLVMKVLPGILERTGAALNVLPCLLGGIFKITGNQAPMIAFGGIRNKLDYESLETRRFIGKHHLDAFKFNPHFPVNTLLIMRGLVAAEMDGSADRYIEAVSAGMWEQGGKMDDPDVVAPVLRDAGLDAASLLARTREQAVKQKLMDNTQAAVDRGAFGVPTFFVGSEMFFGKERLGQVEDMLAPRR